MKKLQTKRVLSLSVLFVFLLSGVSFAAFTTYTNQAAWEAAVPGAIVNEDFNSSAVGYWTDPINESFTGFTITGSTEGDNIGIVDGAGAANLNGTNYLGWNGSGTGPSMTITFTSPTTSFGFDWNDTDNTDSYKITIDGNDWTEPPFSATTGTGFWGVVSTVPFTVITLTQTAAGGTVQPFGLDNFRSDADPTGGASSTGVDLSTGAGGGCFISESYR